MSTKDRRARERAEREATILEAARELAEREGWSAVTTRRLAERIEYSQPVLYSHFAGKDAIVAAVAREGFVELAAETRRRAGAADAGGARARVEATVSAYLDFARAHPATYGVMFTAPTELRFAADDTPGELQEGFAALRDPLADLLGLDRSSEAAGLRTELLWSALHGLATLTAAGRIPARDEAALVALLVETAQAETAQSVTGSASTP